MPRFWAPGQGSVCDVAEPFRSAPRLARTPPTVEGKTALRTSNSPATGKSQAGAAREPSDAGTETRAPESVLRSRRSRSLAGARRRSPVAVLANAESSAWPCVQSAAVFL
ncbi:unnamed protein product, partial [Phaeothamnion confervicola]